MWEEGLEYTGTIHHKKGVCVCGGKRGTRRPIQSRLFWLTTGSSWESGLRFGKRV